MSLLNTDIYTLNTKHPHNIIYNYYIENNNNQYISSDDHINIIKWSLYALANTPKYNDILLSSDINAQYIRQILTKSTRLDKLNIINQYNTIDYKESVEYCNDMHKWISNHCILPIPECITPSNIKYYSMSSLITNYCLRLDNIRNTHNNQSNNTHQNPYFDNIYAKFETIRAIYKSPIDNILYSAVIALTVPILDYKFNPNDEYATSPNYKYICLDIPYDNNYTLNNQDSQDSQPTISPNLITKVIGGIIFRPLNLLYICIDDVMSIGKHFGYQSVISCCDNSQWQSIFK